MEMFNKEEIERLKIEKENVQGQLKIKNMQYDQLQKQYDHKVNELEDIVSDVFLSFRRIVEITERNDYGNPQQKISKIKEFAQDMKNYYAGLTLGKNKNRVTTTDND